MATKKGGLGKGLDAIFMENESENSNSAVKLKLSEIEPNRTQPRSEFNDEALVELAASISQHGVLQPLLVRPLLTGGYQIVAGERRFRASRMAGLSEVPVVIRELSDSETMEIALIENLQREDLSAIEEALGYKTLIDTYNFTQDEVSKSVGKSRPAVTNALRLLNLPEQVIDMIKNGDLSAGHARALLAIHDEAELIKAAEQAKNTEMSVRDLEKLAKKVNTPTKKKSEKEKKSSYFSEVELALTEHLGRKVKISALKANESGVLEIDFYSPEDLQELVKLLDK
ncbi:MAG: ParB/RepB/Spo0J family partition protein [Bacillota bacterium]|nr:ParB/RepB/Spo0J family partition protein [Bacillota bacterium]